MKVVVEEELVVKLWLRRRGRRKRGLQTYGKRRWRGCLLDLCPYPEEDAEIIRDARVEFASN